jgi:hypothetical protein
VLAGHVNGLAPTARVREVFGTWRSALALARDTTLADEHVHRSELTAAHLDDPSCCADLPPEPSLARGED